MECNKDEAVRAKEISQKKFEAKDYLSAKKFALKAQSLYPGLDGIQHMLTTLDVYISSETRVSGESDWYKVLDVSPSADEETIRKQYRKLALVLHPDKNKSIGADGAFKLISEAWSFLSDKVKRAAFDQLRSVKIVKPQVSSAASNGVRSSSKSTTIPTPAPPKRKPATKKSKTSNGPTPAAPQSYPITPTFWSVCHRCRLQHEYFRVYLHKNLLCPSCNEPYYAFEYPPPSQISKMPSQPYYFQQNQAGFSTGGSFPTKHADHFHSSSIPTSSSGPSGFPSIPAFQASHEKFKRECVLNAEEKKREAGSSADANAVKKRKVVEDSTIKKAQGAESSSVEPKKRVKVNRAKNSSDLPSLDPKFLADIAKGQIKKKLDEWKNSKDVATRVNVAGNGNIDDLGKGSDQSSGLKSMTVPDPDFHDFDKDRAETKFGKNQVWAAYDDDDGMPRFYAIIHEVVSSRPFKVKISWLNSKTNDELGPLNWVRSGFTKTSGHFHTGHKVISESVNSFSHKVRFTKGEQGVISIFPKKGEVWAVYRNWSTEWDQLTPENIIHEYDMVEVIEDYDKQMGVQVSPLVKVAAFKTVFRRHCDEKQIKLVPREEIFRFSHQVPSVLLNGQEGQNAPKGCIELDPAATPLELLQVISDCDEENEKKKN